MQNVTTALEAGTPSPSREAKKQKPGKQRTSLFIPTEAKRISEGGHKIAQEWRLERTREDNNWKRFRGIVEMKFGGKFLAMLIDENDSRVRDEDRSFCRDMWNRGVEKRRGHEQRQCKVRLDSDLRGERQEG